MTLTSATATYWDVDGTSLQTFAWNIRSRGGDRMAPPPVRGGNLEVPGLHGRVWRPKVPDQRVIGLDMWVIGARSDGTIVDEAEFDKNWRALRALLWNPLAQLTLTKRFYVDGVLVTASGLAQFDKGLNPEITGGRRAKFDVDLMMADPWFYGDVVEVPALSPGGSETVDVAGDWPTWMVRFTVNGPLASPRLTVGDRWVQYDGLVAQGDVAVVDVGLFTADQRVADAWSKAAGYVTHSGGSRWLELPLGESEIALSAQSGTGTVDVSFKPVWM